ncbi:glycosyltransferase [Chromohalobacter sp. 296-RDG]|uniref:glycosyltransferase n=1 Tax=Chromohalobacter sp. 296-RDG TaxID=2994062 RepID=UPI0024684AA2|nr:glycosyltransferase [Chromohalobacter sp. 296-RDG]
MTLFVLQDFVFPRMDFGAPFDMYYRQKNEHTTPIISGKQKVIFSKNGTLFFDTYFNALSVQKWKEHCSVDDVAIQLKGQGKFSVFFGIHRLGRHHKWLSDSIVELDEEGVTVPFPNWGELEGGLLYFSVKCLSDDGEVWGGSWMTNTRPPNNPLKLGIVVTHFNRKEYVLPAIARMREELLNDPEYQGKIEMVVVDNSQNITDEESEGVTILPNQNLGGSGGFTRGLMYLKDKGDFTHCLFMDDDASCEVESIKRAYNFLSHGVTNDLAISGGLLRELEPNRLFEKGAKFDGAVQPLKSGLDMTSPHDLMIAEEGSYEPDYGAWWFFAFPIASVKNYAFPFFVRGDDIIFGKLNDFKIETLNGVSCWGEDFGLKSSPMSVYLDVRNHLVQNFTHIRSSGFYIVKMLAKFFVSNVFSYNYASARSVILAVEDFMKGPDYWRDDLDAAVARKRVGEQASLEKMVPVNLSDYEFSHVSMHESAARKWLRFLTLNGFLLPSFLIKGDVVYQEKGFRANFREIFRHRSVLYCHGPSSVGYVARHDKKKFFSELLIFSSVLWKLFRKRGELRKEYRESLEEMTSENFWKNVYSGE